MRSINLRLIIGLICAAALITVSCKKKKDEKVNDTLSVFPSELVFEAKSTDIIDVKVETNVSDWSFTKVNNWITAKKKDNVLSVSVSQNNTENSREGIINVVAGNKSAEIEVFQWGMNSLSVSPESVSFYADETSSKSVSITTNAHSWDTDVSENWISVEKQSNTLIIKPKDFNREITQRNATITVTAGSASPVTVGVIQAGLLFGNSTYTATGTPPSLPNPGPGNWSGNLEVNFDLDATYYAISKWANKVLMYLDYKNGNVTLDGTTVILEYNNLYLCFAVGYFQGSNFVIKSSSFQYPINYNSDTKTLDFSGTVDGQTAVVGLVGRNKTTGQAQTLYIDTFYSNAKLVLTPKSNKSPINVVKSGDNNHQFSGKGKLKVNTLNGDTKISVENVKYFNELLK